MGGSGAGAARRRIGIETCSIIAEGGWGGQGAAELRAGAPQAGEGPVLKHPRRALDRCGLDVGALAVSSSSAPAVTAQRPAELRAGPSPACGYLLGCGVVVAHRGMGLQAARMRAVLFDFDFTLADSTPGVVECFALRLRAARTAERSSRARAPDDRARRSTRRCGSCTVSRIRRRRAREPAPDALHAALARLDVAPRSRALRRRSPGRCARGRDATAGVAFVAVLDGAVAALDGVRRARGARVPRRRSTRCRARCTHSRSARWDFPRSEAQPSGENP